MSKRKNKRRKNEYSSDDIRDIRGKGTRKNKTKARRHNDKSYLEQIKNEMNNNPEDLKKHMDYSD